MILPAGRAVPRPILAPVASTEELRALEARCTRFVQGHGRRTAADLLAEIPPDTELDRYGEGGVVTALEERVAALLGTEAAAFLPSGTMAQQIALRVHAEARGRRGVVFHPACHLDWHEGRGYERLHGLVALQAGDLHRPLTREDLEAVAEAPAALLLELPQRDLGGQLPSFPELEEMAAWARRRGAAVHMDGARLWEAAPFYERPLAEIAGLFDTVYVSFYKGLGALAGCALAGPAGTVAEVRGWRRRHGGTLYSMWPNAASAMAGLDRRLPRMGEYLAHARRIADLLGGLEGVRLLPEVPQAPMMHLFIEASREDFEARVRRLAEDEGLFTWAATWPFELPGVQRVEFSVGEATLALSPEEVSRAVRFLAGGA